MQNVRTKCPRVNGKTLQWWEKENARYVRRINFSQSLDKRGAGIC